MRAAFDPFEVLRILDRCSVGYVVIGGFAGRLLGSPLVTEDLDICYSRDPKDLDRLVGALEEMEATLRGAPDDVPFKLDAKTLATGDHFTFATIYGSLNILGTPAGSGGFEALKRSASLIDVNGLAVPVASVDDLIEMKLATGRPKDLSAAEVLGALREELEG